MHSVWVIARRELSAYFDSLTAYIILVAFLGFSGFFTWLYGADVFLRRQADLQVFFSVARWTLFFFIPALTMRQLAEERRSGTIEMLLTKAVSDRQVVIGKFVGCLLMVIIALLFTLPYYITVAQIGNIDHLGSLARVEVFDWKKEERTHEFKGDTHKGLVERLEFHPDQAWLLAAGGDHGGFIKFLDIEKSKIIKQEKAPMHVHDLVLSERYDTIFAAGHGKIVVWKMA